MTTYAKVVKGTEEFHQRVAQLLMVRPFTCAPTRTIITLRLPLTLILLLLLHLLLLLLQARTSFEKNEFATMCATIRAEDDEDDDAPEFDAELQKKTLVQLNKMFAFIKLRVILRPCEVSRTSHYVLISTANDSLAKLATRAKPKQLRMLQTIIKTLSQRAARGVGTMEQTEAVNKRGDLSTKQAHAVLERAVRQGVLVPYRPPGSRRDGVEAYTLGVRTLAEYEEKIVGEWGVTKCVVSDAPVLLGPRCDNPDCARRITLERHEAQWKLGGAARKRKRKRASASSSSSSSSSSLANVVSGPEVYGLDSVVKCTECAVGTFVRAVDLVGEDVDEDMEAEGAAAAAMGGAMAAAAVTTPPRRRAAQSSSAAS